MESIPRKREFHLAYWDSKNLNFIYKGLIHIIMMRTAKGDRMTTRENRKRIRLYEQGLNDREIAEKCGVSLWSIFSWRKRRNLPSISERIGSKRGKKLTKNEDEKRVKLYEQGFDDREIAEKRDVSQTVISSWRRKHNLLSTVERGKKSGGPPLGKEENERRMKLYKHGLNDREMGEKLGLTSESISYWRKKNDLPPNRLYRSTQEKQEEFLELYKKGLNDREIAQKMDLTPPSIRHWRKKNDLPPNKPHRASQEKRKKFLELYEKGLIDREIAEELDLATFTAYMWRKKHNLKAHQRKNEKRLLSDREFEAEKNFRIRNIRSRFVKVAKQNPLRALKIVKEMKEEEGKEFVEMCLGNLAYNEGNIDKKVVEILKKRAK